MMNRIIFFLWSVVITFNIYATDQSIRKFDNVKLSGEEKIVNSKNLQVNYSFEVSVKDTSLHLFHVVLNCNAENSDTIEFHMSNWTPGYYQLMHYADNVQLFKVKDVSGNSVKWLKSDENIWKVIPSGKKKIIIEYDFYANKRFVAGNYLDRDMGYISPAGAFIYPSGKLNQAVKVKIIPFRNWTVASGMDKEKTGIAKIDGEKVGTTKIDKEKIDTSKMLKGKAGTEKNDVQNNPVIFYANNFDILFDSPILWGNIESFPSFKVRGIPHYFEAIKAGSFDRQIFMNDLEKMVKAASDIIGDIPYTHYSFLAMGPGGGGIEHLNSASIAFNGDEMNKREGKIRTMNFLAHEYFHHYNVKRIRPVELGPFDYDHGSRTSLLWFSEGITVYYEYLILKRAGITTGDEMLDSFKGAIQSFLNKEGRKFQSPADASIKTWDEGPFGRTQDKINKTISVYDKGALLGLMLDFKIRHETDNKKSLDDLMRLLYHKYYKKLGRGFSEQEFRTEAENIAGTQLNDFFDQVYTVKEINYNTYLEFAGLQLVESDVSGPQESISRIRNFMLNKMENMDALQASIYKSWMGN